MLLNVNIDINTFLYFVKAGAAYRRQGEGMKRLYDEYPRGLSLARMKDADEGAGHLYSSLINYTRSSSHRSACLYP